MLIPRKTTSSTIKTASKTLIYGFHGAGKTTQAAYYQKRFGNGLILSLEGGLASLKDVDIDYIKVSSWDGDHDPASEVYSFRGVCGFLATEDFRKLNYKWICVDSLTELSDLCYAHFSGHPSVKNSKGEVNNFDLWDKYNTQLIGGMKFLRDLPMHVLATSLAKQEQDNNGKTHYWPAIKGQTPQKQIPGIFDYVFGLIRKTETSGEATKVSRWVVAEELNGWHGKARDPRRRILPFEQCDDITTLLERANS